MDKKPVATVGKLRYSYASFSNGNFGSIYPGRLDNFKEVTIHRIMKSNFIVKLESLQTSQSHPNILNYFHHEENEDYV